MPGYSITTLTPEPILLLTLSDDWDPDAHKTAFLRDWNQALAAADTPIISIVDVHSLGLPGLEDLMWLTGQAAHGANAIIQNAAMRKLLVVSSSVVLGLAHGLRCDPADNARVTICTSVEEAMARAHAAA